MSPKKLARLTAGIVFIITVLLINNTTYEKPAPVNQETLPGLPEIQKETTETTLSQSYRVTKVIDGDTIRLEDGRRVRYIGIDTPETVAPGRKVQCYGREAAEMNKELVEGKEVRMEKDVSETDRYGRLLRYVYVDDIFVNEYLVKEGYAYAESYSPDTSKQDMLDQAEITAREKSRGLWAVCPR